MMSRRHQQQSQPIHPTGYPHPSPLSSDSRWRGVARRGPPRWVRQSRPFRRQTGAVLLGMCSRQHKPDGLATGRGANWYPKVATEVKIGAPRYQQRWDQVSATEPYQHAYYSVNRLYPLVVCIHTSALLWHSNNA